MFKTLFTFIALLAQVPSGHLAFDKIVHDFGDVMTSSGPLKCSFAVKNTSTEDVTIYSVVSSCGCTDVDWTRTAIAPGKTGKITATYSNDEGAGSFDKTLTVYGTDSNKPVILHLKGTIHEKSLPLDELFPVHYGPLAVKSSEIKAGNMSQGEQRSGYFEIANISNARHTVAWSGISDGLVLKCEKSSINPGEKIKVNYTVSSDRSRWGKSWYYATLLVDGRSVQCKGRPAESESAKGAESLRSDPNARLAEFCTEIGIWTITKENFKNLGKEERRLGSMPKLEESTVNFGKIKSGKSSEVTFKLSNTGKKDLTVYKVEMSSSSVRFKTFSGKPAPSGSVVVPKATSASLVFSIDTKGLPKGEQLFLVTLYTDSPLRPVVNMYISGFIQ